MKVAISAMFCCLALAAQAEDGLRMESRVSPGVGIDPSFAPGWLNPQRERLGFSNSHWRDAVGFTPSGRMQLAYPMGSQTSLGMSVSSGKDYDNAPVYGTETRQYGLFGRYSLAPDWSLSAEALSRDPNTLLRLQDFRIGLRREF